MLILPWPPPELNPNQRMHWGAKHRIAKSYRRACYFLTRKHGVVAPEGEVLLELEFVPPDNRKRDDDNVLASFKSGRDGIAEALGIDDNRFITQFRLSDKVVEGGEVRVRIKGVDHG